MSRFGRSFVSRLPQVFQRVLLTPFERNRASFASKSLVVTSYPSRLRVEITNDCNLFCTFSDTFKKYGGCPQWLPKKKIQHMPFDLFKRVIDEASPYLIELEPYNYGEPFMNPDACAMLRYARSKNASMRMDIHTNGHYFRTTKEQKDALECGLDMLSVSVDGLTQETYERYRVKGDLKRVLDGIAGLCRMKKILGFKKPEIVFQFIVFDHNFDETPRVQSFAENLGVDRVNIKVNLPHLARRMAQEYPQLSPAHDSEENFAKKDAGNELGYCDFPWTYPTILSDGRVVSCCRDGMLETVLGSVAESSLWDVWNGPQYREFRRRFLQDENLPAPCRSCPCAPRTPPLPLGMRERYLRTNDPKLFRLRFLMNPFFVRRRMGTISSFSDFLLRSKNILTYLGCRKAR